MTARPIATDARAYADAAIKQGKTVLSQASTAVNTATDRAVELVEDAPKPVFAVLGAADLAVETVAKRLPKSATHAYLSTAKDVYDTLTARGEAKIAALRNDPHGQAPGRCQRRSRNPSGQDRPGRAQREVGQPAAQAGPPRCAGP